MFWLWKHRKAWRHLKELWDNRIELISFMREVDFALNLGKKPTEDKLKSIGEQAKHHYEWLDCCGTGKARRLHPWPDPPLLKRPMHSNRIPPVREWRISPPPAPPEPTPLLLESRAGDYVLLLRSVPTQAFARQTITAQAHQNYIANMARRG